MVRKMTEDNLKAAFAGESQAHMRYISFANRAERDGKANVARLFRAISYAEEIHATNHLRELGQIGNTAENLAAAIGGENFEVDEMYPAYMAVAELQGEKGGLRSMNWAFQAEKLHAQFYSAAREAVVADEDAPIGDVYVCPGCGYTHIGDPLDKCPVCGAAGKLFHKF